MMKNRECTSALPKRYSSLTISSILCAKNIGKRAKLSSPVVRISLIMILIGLVRYQSHAELFMTPVFTNTLYSNYWPRKEPQAREMIPAREKSK